MIGKMLAERFQSHIILCKDLGASFDDFPYHLEYVPA